MLQSPPLAARTRVRYVPLLTVVPGLLHSPAKRRYPPFVVGGPCIRRIPDVQDPALAGAHFDYADCFEVRTAAPMQHSPESLARAALEGMPLALRGVVLGAHRFVLRLRLGPLSSADHVLGWQIVASSADLVVLEADGPIMRGVMIGRRTGSGVTVLRTYVFYQRPFAPFIWSVVGVLHRRVAPYLLRRATAEG